MIFVAYDTLMKEAKDLPEDMIDQVIEFMRFLKYTSEKEQAKDSVGNHYKRRNHTAVSGENFVVERIVSKSGIRKTLLHICNTVIFWAKLHYKIAPDFFGQ